MCGVVVWCGNIVCPGAVTSTAEAVCKGTPVPER